MLRLLADHNFNEDIVAGLLLRKPNLDVVRAQDVALSRAEDPVVLAWAADAGRILVTHDVNTMPRFAYDRVRAGLPMPGVFEVHQDMSVGRAIDELLILIECSQDGEWEGQVHYLPLR